MILQLLGLVAIVVFTYFVFKTAKEYGRAAGLWAFVALAVGIGFQWLVPVILMIIITLVLLVTGTRPEQIEDTIGWWSFGIAFVCVALSLVGMFLILRQVAKLPDDAADADIRVPPPPPIFDGQD
jgi:hypothetical protein